MLAAESDSFSDLQTLKFTFYEYKFCASTVIFSKPPSPALSISTVKNCKMNTGVLGSGSCVCRENSVAKGFMAGRER